MQNTVQVQLSIEQNVKESFVEVANLRRKIKEKRKAVNDAFLNDKEYYDASKKVADLRLQMKNRKLKILEENPAITTMQEELDEMKDGLQSEQMSLNDYLLMYIDQTGNTTIPDASGDIVEIKIEKKVHTKKI